jgi:N-glycosylase/DNA lyase
MTKSSGQSPAQQPSTTEALQDRRSNPELRRLIEEMLKRVREMNRNVAVWSAEERARAEADLELVMARVRRLAGERREEKDHA